MCRSANSFLHCKTLPSLFNTFSFHVITDGRRETLHALCAGIRMAGSILVLNQCLQVFGSIQVKSPFREIHECRLIAVAFDDLARAFISCDAFQFRKQWPAKDCRHARPFCVARGCDQGLGLAVFQQKRLQHSSREMRLVGDQEQNALTERSSFTETRRRSRWLFFDRFNPAAQRRGHSGWPVWIENNPYLKAAQRLLHALCFKSEDDDNGRASGLQRETRCAAQKSFTIELHKLFGPPQPRGSASRQHDGGAVIY